MTREKDIKKIKNLSSLNRFLFKAYQNIDKGGVMKYKIFLACLGILAIFAHLQAGWLLQHLGTHDLYCIDFPPNNITTGFACGSGGLILKTTDGGAYGWWGLESPVSMELNGISFTNEVQGYVAVGDSGFILKTVDGGVNWTILRVGQNVSFTAIHFPVDNYIGYAVGLRGAIWMTFDGMSWGDISILEPVNLHGLHFIDNLNGWIVGDNGYIAHTHNAGLNWHQEISNVNVRLLGVYFRNLNNGWVVGDCNTFLKTTNSGAVWDTVHIPLPESTTLYSAIFPVDVNNGFICGSEGKTAWTRNRCISWDTTTVTGRYHLYRVEFPQDNYTGWVCGSQEAIFKTSEYGIKDEDSRKTNKRFNLLVKMFQNNNLAFSLSLPEPATVSLSLYNLQGQKILSWQISASQGSFHYVKNLPKLSSGIYFINAEVLGEGYKENKRLVIVK